MSDDFARRAGAKLKALAAINGLNCNEVGDAMMPFYHEAQSIMAMTVNTPTVEVVALPQPVRSDVEAAFRLGINPNWGSDSPRLQ